MNVLPPRTMPHDAAVDKPAVSEPLPRPVVLTGVALFSVTLVLISVLVWFGIV